MNNDTRDQLYENLLNSSREDNNIVGFILAGSRGKGVVTEYSDYDVIIVVEDNNIEQYKQKYSGLKASSIEIHVLSFSDFVTFAEWGSDHEWDRYNFTHLKAQVDKKDGSIQSLIDLKGAFPKERIHDYVTGSLDAFINSVYRSLKDYRDGLHLASKLDATESVSFLLNLIFAYNGRIRPYNKYLEWELTNYPLDTLPWSNNKFLAFIKNIESDKWIPSLKEILSDLENFLRKDGYSEVFDGWGDKLKWMKTPSL